MRDEVWRKWHFLSFLCRRDDLDTMRLLGVGCREKKILMLGVKVRMCFWIASAHVTTQPYLPEHYRSCSVSNCMCTSI
jgi:hypothetical protein